MEVTMTLAHYAIISGTFAFVAALCWLAWLGYVTAHQEQDESLGAEAEADKRHLTYILEGRNPNIKTKGQ
jgi:hypothetical protein